MRVVGECFFWYRLTRVFPDKFHRAVKRLCVLSAAGQHASSSCHAKETVDLLSTETPAFIPPTLWLRNSPDLNAVDDKVWSVLQKQVYKVKVNDVDALHQRMQTVWDELDQRIIDKVIKQWRTRLLVRACIEAKGGHFEHNF